ncbi:uncharacterized protein VTP21DRAFT_6615 [Calcarisporiella thermophila]|uniref:uncharacterized protein n=1 Tax=Calcarisporiella thermophila TaxID=911321 RepID=UPI0037448D95
MSSQRVKSYLPAIETGPNLLSELFGYDDTTETTSTNVIPPASLPPSQPPPPPPPRPSQPPHPVPFSQIRLDKELPKLPQGIPNGEPNSNHASLALINLGSSEPPSNQNSFPTSQTIQKSPEQNATLARNGNSADLPSTLNTDLLPSTSPSPSHDVSSPKSAYSIRSKDALPPLPEPCMPLASHSTTVSTATNEPDSRVDSTKTSISISAMAKQEDRRLERSDSLPNSNIFSHESKVKQQHMKSFTSPQPSSTIDSVQFKDKESEPSEDPEFDAILSAMDDILKNIPSGPPSQPQAAASSTAVSTAMPKVEAESIPLISSENDKSSASTELAGVSKDLPPILEKHIKPNGATGASGDDQIVSLPSSVYGPGGTAAAVEVNRSSSMRLFLSELKLSKFLEGERLFLNDLEFLSEVSNVCLSMSEKIPAELMPLLDQALILWKLNREFYQQLLNIKLSPKYLEILGSIMDNWVNTMEEPYSIYFERHAEGIQSLPAILRIDELSEALKPSLGTQIQELAFRGLLDRPLGRVKHYKDFHMKLSGFLKERSKSTKPKGLAQGEEDQSEQVTPRQPQTTEIAEFTKLEEDTSHQAQPSTTEQSPVSTPVHNATSTSQGNDDAGSARDKVSPSSIISSTTSSTIDTRGSVRSSKSSTTSSFRSSESGSFLTSAIGTEASPNLRLHQNSAKDMHQPLLGISEDIPEINGDSESSNLITQFENQISSDDVRDLFTMKPRVCKLQLNPPQSAPRYFVKREDMSITVWGHPVRASTSGSDVGGEGKDKLGIMAEPETAHVVLLNNLLIFCRHVTAAEQSETGKRYRLMYPPLAFRHLKFSQGEDECDICVTVMNTVRIVMRANSHTSREAWLHEAGQLGLVSDAKNGHSPFLQRSESQRWTDLQQLKERTISMASISSMGSVVEVLIRTGECDVYRRKQGVWQEQMRGCRAEIRATTTGRTLLVVLPPAPPQQAAPAMTLLAAPSPPEEERPILRIWILSGTKLVRSRTPGEEAVLLFWEVGGRGDARLLRFDRDEVDPSMAEKEVSELLKVFAGVKAELPQLQGGETGGFVSRSTSLSRDGIEDEPKEEGRPVVPVPSIAIEDEAPLLKSRCKLYIQGRDSMWISLGLGDLHIFPPPSSIPTADGNRLWVQITKDGALTTLINTIILPGWVERLGPKRVSVMVQNENMTSTVFMMQLKDDRTGNEVFTKLKMN